ncbi:unnamed protein product [Brassica oleracea]
MGIAKAKIDIRLAEAKVISIDRKCEENDKLPMKLLGLLFQGKNHFREECSSIWHSCVMRGNPRGLLYHLI